MVTLTDNSYKLSLTAVGTQERCHNTGDGSVNLTVNNGTGPYTYQWPGGRTTEDISGLSGGQRYKVAAFDIAWLYRYNIGLCEKSAGCKSR